MDYLEITDTNDWITAAQTGNIGVNGEYLSMPPSLFDTISEFIQWLKDGKKIPVNGSVTNPVIQPVVASAYLDLTGSFTGQYPVYYISQLGSTSSVWTNGFYIYRVNNIPSDGFLFPLSWFNFPSQLRYTFTNNNNTINIYSGRFSGSISGNYYFGQALPFQFPFADNSSNYITGYFGLPTIDNPSSYSFIPDSSFTPFISFVLMSNDEYRARPFLFYKGIDGNYYTSYFNNIYSISYNGVSYPLFLNTFKRSGNVNIESIGNSNPTFNDTDKIYIDLQLGDLSSVSIALTDLLSAINQNLINATIAIQEANSANLPVDTTPFIQLVQSYEELTNDVISGEVSITSGLTSMYTLLSGSIANITNPTLTNACISAYNAFLNKLSLFQSAGGGSNPNYTYTTVQTLQGQLNTLYSNYISGIITYSNMLTIAASDLSDAVEDATSTQEIISLNSVYQSFIDYVGATIQGSTYSKDVLDNFEDILDDYESGSISASEALSQLKSEYQLGISSAKTAVDVGAIVSGYQASIDQISVHTFDLSVASADNINETLDLEADLISKFDLSEFESYINFNQWQLMNNQEANLYREYFQRILNENSPFFGFIFYPLVLSMVGLLLGTRVHFKRKEERPTELLDVKDWYSRHNMDI